LATIKSEPCGVIDHVGKSSWMKPGVVVDDIPNGVGVTVEVGEGGMYLPAFKRI